MVIEINGFSSKIIQIEVDDYVYLDPSDNLYKTYEISTRTYSINVIFKNKKLRAEWTLETKKDLEAYHSIDAEEELTKIIIDELKNNKK